MKSFDKLIVIFIVLTAAMFTALNFVLLSSERDVGALHNVEINRVMHVISDSGEIPDTSGYETILGVYAQSGGSEFFVSENDYVIREINGRLYRIEYEEKRDNGSTVLYVNITAGVFAAAVFALLIYIRHNIIKPFARMSELPYELAKGGLTVPLTENRSRYFGKFLWGLDMLRESTEKTRQSELSLQKEKKTMLISLSHDIKTPLSAIKLYSAALSKGIYSDPDKQRETAANIGAKADEIERLVNEIMKSGTEDIIKFEVNSGEFYLSEVIGRIGAHYREKLSGTEFIIREYGDCLINGDPDRLNEVLQNIIENAVKYGDGQRIELTFADEENCRLITVANSGCTLPDGEAAHIFDSFWRGSNVGSKSGSGLGLYICRRLMSAMGGDIFAEIRGGDMCVTVVCARK